jgi:hypothetical protein
MESKVLRSADLDYAHRLDDVWESNPYSVGELHASIRESLLFELEQLGLSSRSRLIRGPGGAGKTHFLGTLRQALSEAAPGTACSEATFILVDMTDVARFWHTVLLGYLESLHKDLRGSSGVLQLDSVLEELFKQISSRGATLHGKLRRCSTEDFPNLTKEILGGLHKKFRAEVGHYQNVLRAFLALGTENFDLSNVGYTWLLGEFLDEEKLALLGIGDREQDPREILRGLTWILSLRGNTLLCLDQIDAIVAQGALYSRETPSEQLPEEERKAKGIILNLASGLAALQDQTSRTLVVLSCLEQSFYILRDHALQNLMDRFSESFSLNTVPSAEMAQKIIAQRMAPAFQAQDFTPPYATWPFAPEAFENIQSLYTPREILQMCQEHRLRCLQEDEITELRSFMGTPSKREDEQEGQEQEQERGQDHKQEEKTTEGNPETTPPEPPADPPVPPKFSILDQRFGELEKRVDPTNYLGEDQEDALGELLRLGARLLLWETPLQRNMDIELDPMGSLPSDPLNARIRLIFRSEGDREQHYCFRVIQKNNHNAYRSRLAKALTASGIEKELSFRRLTVFRTLPPVDSGEQTKKQNRAFQKAGGRFAPVTEQEILVLGALKKMFEENDPYFPDWIKKRRLVSQLQCMQIAFPWITRLSPPPKKPEASPGEITPLPSGTEKAPEKPEEREPQEFWEEPPRSTSKNATFERTPSPSPEKPREEGIISRVTRWFRKEEESLTVTRESLPSPNPEEFLSGEGEEKKEPPEDAPHASETSHTPEGSERSQRREPSEVSEASNPKQEPDQDREPEQEPVKKTGIETRTEEEEQEQETPEAPPEEPPHPFPGKSSEEPLLFRGVQEEVLLGTEMLLGETITLPPQVFARHGVILAGSGAGKTVLLKRLVEEAALCGIPSIVIDSANDLSQIGQRWKEPPSSWGEEMHRKAALFEENVEVLLWTPGHTGGRPLHLSPLPDFEALEDDPSGRDTAITMAVESLTERILSGNSKNAQKGRALLTEALRLLARKKGKTLAELTALLQEAPQEISGGMKEYRKLSQDLGDLLAAARTSDPLLHQEGDPLSPKVLYGDTFGSGEKTRISVINLWGLRELESSRHFINTLAMALFSWAKQYPPKNALGLRGLFVLDEARDYIPSVRTSACKESLLRLAAQGRKYGIGLLLASQNPTDIDCKALGQFQTWFLGRAQAPRAIEQSKKMLQEWGLYDGDVARLQKGNFYVHSGEAISPPLEVTVPLSISAHPDRSPLSEEEILRIARGERLAF